MKVGILKEEGVRFDGKGMLVDWGCFWDGFDVEGI